MYFKTLFLYAVQLSCGSISVHQPQSHRPCSFCLVRATKALPVLPGCVGLLYPTWILGFS